MEAVTITLVPLVGGKRPVTVRVGADLTIGEAILAHFPELRGNRLVVHDGERGVSTSSRVRELRSDKLLFWPYTFGG